jgi:hypothetical protein
VEDISTRTVNPAYSTTTEAMEAVKAEHGSFATTQFALIIVGVVAGLFVFITAALVVCKIKGKQP